MKSKKKNSTIIIAIIIVAIIIIAGFSLYNSDYFKEHFIDHDVTVEESAAVSGTPFELHFSSTEEKTSVIFPDNVLVEHHGIFRNRTTYNFTGRSAAINVLIPPTETSIVVEMKSKYVKDSFELEVQGSGETLVSGASYYQHEATMARVYNNRNVGTPQLRRAAEHYNSFFKQLGYESEIREYQKTSGFLTYDVLDVVAYKWGTEYPDEWIILGGHYDIARRSIEGAYDNAAGATAVVELAEGFASLTTSRTIVFGLWDGEEEGLWGSSLFADDIPSKIDVKAYINFDMVGLNWPLPYTLLILTGPNENDDIEDCPILNNAARDAAFKYMGYPEQGIDIHESSGGGSDHLSFQRIGTQTYFFYGDSPYIQYHRRTDLLADMVAYAGSRENLEQGFATVAWIAFYITLLLDNDNLLHQVEIEET